MNKAESVKRCYQFIVAVYSEVEKLENLKPDEGAYMLAKMQVHLTEYMMQIWPTRAALEADLVAIEESHDLSPNSDRLLLDFEKVLLWLYVEHEGLPNKESEKWKMFAKLTDWDGHRIIQAIEEGVKRGLIDRKPNIPTPPSEQ